MQKYELISPNISFLIGEIGPYVCDVQHSWISDQQLTFSSVVATQSTLNVLEVHFYATFLCKTNTCCNSLSPVLSANHRVERFSLNISV